MNWIPSSASAPAVNILQALLSQQMSSGNRKTDHHISNGHSARDVLEFCEYYIAVTGSERDIFSSAPTDARVPTIYPQKI